MSVLGDKLVCSFKLATDMSEVELGSFCMTQTINPERVSGVIECVDGNR